jgi:hypothetical protein
LTEDRVSAAAVIMDRHAAPSLEGIRMPSKPKSTKKPSADKLVKTTRKDNIELKEEDLEKVTGGLIGLLNKNKGD